jgi:hypothetical protein
MTPVTRRSPDEVAARMLHERLSLEEARLRQFILLLGDEGVQERLPAGVVRTLEQYLVQHERSLEALSDSGSTWERLQERRWTSDRLLSECLAVVLGALFRPVAALDKSCHEAQALAAELQHLTGIGADSDVIPSSAECVSPLSGVVRRRFPDHGLWDLPVIAHEFGHLMARDLVFVDPATGEQSRPVAEMLAGAQRQEAELVSDIFAVFVGGPAYVLTLVLHRMDPFADGTAGANATHPGDASRVVACLRALQLLDLRGRRAQDVPESERDYAFLVDALSAWWDSAQASAPERARLDVEQRRQVMRTTERWWSRLTDSRMTSSRYAGFPRALLLARALEKGEKPLDPEATCRDVLNAAWLLRFRAWRDGRPLPESVQAWALDRLRQTAT